MWLHRDELIEAARGRWHSRKLESLPAHPGTYAIYRRDPIATRSLVETDRSRKTDGRRATALPAATPARSATDTQLETLGTPTLVYIGSANNIRARLQDFGVGNRWPKRVTHFGQVDRLTIKVAIDRKPLQHLTREARLIQRLQPPLNRKTWRTHK